MANCPRCGHTWQQSVNVGSALPAFIQQQPGDIVVCIGCRHVFEMQQDRSYRELSGDELKNTLRSFPGKDARALLNEIFGSRN